jgi:thioredoxin 1
MAVNEANDETFAGLIAGLPGRILVDFWAPSCPPCIDIGKRLKALAPGYADSIVIVKVNADECPDTASSFGVRGLPTLVLLKDGKELNRHIGGLSQARVEKLLSEWANS